jgi:hypothetical protein
MLKPTERESTLLYPAYREMSGRPVNQNVDNPQLAETVN